MDMTCACALWVGGAVGSRWKLHRSHRLSPPLRTAACGIFVQKKTQLKEGKRASEGWAGLGEKYLLLAVLLGNGLREQQHRQQPAAGRRPGPSTSGDGERSAVHATLRGRQALSRSPLPSRPSGVGEAWHGLRGAWLQRGAAPANGGSGPVHSFLGVRQARWTQPPAQTCLRAKGQPALLPTRPALCCQPWAAERPPFLPWSDTHRQTPPEAPGICSTTNAWQDL